MFLLFVGIFRAQGSCVKSVCKQKASLAELKAQAAALHALIQIVYDGQFHVLKTNETVVVCSTPDAVVHLFCTATNPWKSASSPFVVRDVGVLCDTMQDSRESIVTVTAVEFDRKPTICEINKARDICADEVRVVLCQEDPFFVELS